MNKAPRFMKEYANYKIREYESIKPPIPKRASKIALIHAIVKIYERGLITVDEAMRCIALNDSNWEETNKEA